MNLALKHPCQAVNIKIINAFVLICLNIALLLQSTRQSREQNHLRDEVLLEHVSNVLTQMNYSESSPRTAKSRITLVFNEGFEKVFVPPSTQPIISYTEGEFITVTGKINGETVSLFGYIPPRRIERYVKIPAHKIDVYKLMLRIDIYDARTLTMIWSGTANMESSQGRAIEDAKKMIDKLVRERLPEL